ncbi:MAG: hypothetical protein JSR54_12265, partial [Proteobacteria bacterium]|nr:hypothetical protein [Pseudomonadota bacterium]
MRTRPLARLALSVLLIWQLAVVPFVHAAPAHAVAAGPQGEAAHCA